MNNDARNPFAGYQNTLIVHPGWSEFHYLLAALASLLLLLGVFLVRPLADNRVLWSKGTKGCQEPFRPGWRQGDRFRGTDRPPIG